MSWIIGIDEAGYGPNLGPLVMTAVTMRVPDPLVDGNLWKALRKAVRRHPSEDDGRLLVDDSKLVYSTSRGLSDLEMGVLGCLPGCLHESLGPLIDCLCPNSRDDVIREFWFTGMTKVPIEVCLEELTVSVRRFEEACQSSEIGITSVESMVICPPQFNQLLDRWESKGAVLAHALMELFRRHCEPDGDQEPVFIFVDKHGGRNFYAAMLQNVVENGMVVATEEGAERSTYSVRGWKRRVDITFRPRADSTYFCVALAAMVSKYLREALMLEFNQFWQSKLPGLKPTAGYPTDAERFYEAIRPLAANLGLPEDCLWRRK